VSSALTITNVRVFDGRELGEPAAVTIDGAMISAVEPAGGPVRPEAVDGGGGALLPGLIDTHVHADKVSQLETSASWGITTMLDMGNRDPASQAKLTSRPGLPALLRACGPANAPGSVFVTKMGFSASTTVSGPADAARFVADRVAEGADYIKILVEDPKIPRTRALSAETVAAIAAAAKAAGLTTVAHIVSADTLRTALLAGVDVVTHAALSADLDGEFDRLLAGRPAVLIPTLTMMDGVVRAIGGKLFMRLIAPVMPIARMRYAHAVATVSTFRRAGMVILAGTDANDDLTAPCQVPHGESLHEELGRLVGAGLTPAEALRAATTLTAGVFGLTDRGAVVPGRRADLLLVDGDPVTDIAATRAIRGVWIAGNRVR
jgi:imidazolonepropionase-like amidohydrolase